MLAGNLKKYIIIPTLDYMRMNSNSAVNLLLGTAAQESRLGKYLHQINGPALGIYQCEPNTLDDIFNKYLRHRKELLRKVLRLSIPGLTRSKNAEGNLYYATAIARIHYSRVPEKIPDADDIEGLANYWKKYYNTKAGRGTAAQFVKNYKRYVL